MTIAFDSIPNGMQASPRWLVWKFANGRKAPRNAATGLPADSNDPAHFLAFDRACAAYAGGGFDGIGFALSGKDGCVAVDLDDCINPATGEISEYAKTVVQQMDSYTEISPSGTGIKIFVRAVFVPGHKKKGLEILTKNYSTVTGNHLPGTRTTIETRDEQLASLVRREFPETAVARKRTPQQISDGTRNDVLFKEGCRLRQQGKEEEEIVALLLVMNRKRCNPPLDESEVKAAAHSAARYEPGGEDFEKVQAGSRKGEARADSQQNVRLALDKLGVGLRYNVFAAKVLVSYDGHEKPLDDAILHRLWLTIDEMFKFRPTLEFFQIVVSDLAHRSNYHPVRDYLRTLTWDGVARIDTWLTTYAGSQDSPYSRAIGAIFLTAAVRRVMVPGCKFDELLTMEAPQGTNKSSAIRALCPDEQWFSDDLPLGVDSKQVIERTAGQWIIEASELHGYTNADVEKLKAQLSRQTDGPVRLAFGRISTEVPRQFVIIGSGNPQTHYLRDSTGNRRFWPVAVGRCDVEAITRDRDQLWAEAAAREATGASIRLPESLWAAAAEEQDARRAVDPFEDLLEEGGIDFSADAVFVADLWRALGEAGTYRKRNDADRLAQIVQRHGFTRRKKVAKVLVHSDGRRDEPLRLTAWVRGGVFDSWPSEVLVHITQGNQGGRDDRIPF